MDETLVEGILELERKKALEDFYWFSKYIFGNVDMQPHVHGDLCKQLQHLHELKEDGTTEIIVLMPRGHFKSSVATMAYPLWRWLKNPDIRVLITNETFEKAKLFLGVIKSRIEEHEPFRELFGDLKLDPATGKPLRWNLDQVVLPGRTEFGVGQKESTFSAGSPGHTKTGMHYDLIIADDLVSELTVTTPEQIAKTERYYKQLQSLLDPGGELVVIGTRYMYDDIYGTLIERGTADRVILKRAIDDDGNILFPEAFSKATLDELKLKLGSWFFGCQYMNEPTNTDTAVFLEEDIKIVDHNEIPRATVKGLFIDPSRGETAGSDFTALVACFMDEKRNLFVPYAEARHIARPSDLMDWVYAMNAWCAAEFGEGFDFIAVEQVAMQDTAKWMLDRVDTTGSPMLPIMAAKTSNRISKHQRIRAMQPIFQQGRFHFVPNLFDLMTQLTKFPSINKDDLADALSMAPGLLYSPNSEIAQKAVINNDRATTKVNTPGNIPGETDYLKWRY